MSNIFELLSLQSFALFCHEGQYSLHGQPYLFTVQIFSKNECTILSLHCNFHLVEMKAAQIYCQIYRDINCNICIAVTLWSCILTFCPYSKVFTLLNLVKKYRRSYRYCNIQNCISTVFPKSCSPRNPVKAIVLFILNGTGFSLIG